MNLWGIAVAAFLGAIAWTYQQSWEHQKRRVEMYSAIIDLLPYFTRENRNTEKMNKALTEGRRLWLSAPDDVVQAFEKVLDVAEGKIDDCSAFGDCVAAMRRDSTYRSALFPRFWETKLPSAHFRLRTASSTSGDLQPDPPHFP